MFNNNHDRCDTISNIFHSYFGDFLMKFWEIYQKCSNSVNFWARKMFFFFKWVRISPEIDWYHYQGASPAPTCIVRHQTMTKTPTRWSVTSEPCDKKFLTVALNSFLWQEVPFCDNKLLLIPRNFFLWQDISASDKKFLPVRRNFILWEEISSCNKKFLPI